MEGMSLENALELIFERAATGDVDELLTYVVRNEVLTITSVAKADERFLTTRAYPVAHLLAVDPSFAEPVAYSQATGSSVDRAGGGFFSVADIEEEEERDAESLDSVSSTARLPRIVTLVQQMTSPPAIWSDMDARDDGVGRITLVGTNLIIRQSQPAHREIVRLLNLLNALEQ